MANILEDILSVAKSKVAMVVFALLKAMIIARYLGPVQNGYIAALVIYPTLFMTVGSLGIRKSSAYLLGSGLYNENQIKSAVFHLWILSTLFSVICIYTLIEFTSKTSYSTHLILLAIGPVPFSLLNTYLSGIYLGKNEIKAFNEINWLPAFIILFFTYLFIVAFDLSIEGALMAEFIGNAAMAFILFIRMRFFRYVNFSFNTALLKALSSLGLAYAVSLLILNLNYRLDVIILDWLSTPYEIGIYSKGAVLMQYLWEIPMMLGTIVFARGARSKDRAAFSLKVTQLLRVSMVVIAVGSLGLALLSSQIIWILFGKEFLPSASVMLWLLPGVLLLTIFKVLNMDMGGQGKPMFALKSMVPALVVNVVLNILLIPGYGANGAAFASTISYSFGAILFLVQYSNATTIPLSTIFRYSMDDFSFALPYLNKFKHLLHR